MIDLNLQLAAVEKYMQLMEQYGIEELSIDYLHLVRHKKAAKTPPVTEDADLQQHLQSLPDQPWLALSDQDIEPFSRTGRV